MNITVIIHTYNSQKDIQECIESAKLLTDHINIIDMQSDDKTAEIALNNGAQILSIPQSHYVEPAREFGIQSAKTEWVFILDSDERITLQLAEEVRNVIARTDSKGRSNPHTTSQNVNGIASTGTGLYLSSPDQGLAMTRITYYKVPRKNIFGRKKWLQHGGWWPDHQIRLIHKPDFKAWPKRIHSTPEITGEMGFLQQPILHYFHGNIESMVEKTIIFEDIESDLLFKADREVKTQTFFRKYFGELARRLIKQIGFLDGEIGIIENVYQAFSKTITYLYLYEKKKSRAV